MLTRTVKISNVTNLSDARYCAGMGVEMLGFSIDEDAPQYISPKKFEDICSWLAGVHLVAETSLTDAATILKKLEEYPVHAVQVETPDLLNYLGSELNLPLILKLNADTYGPDDIAAILHRYADSATHFLLESDNQPLSADWLDGLAKLPQDISVLIGFGLEEPASLDQLGELPPNIGIALKGSEEIRPGYKDFGSMMDILEALEEQ